MYTACLFSKIGPCDRVTPPLPLVLALLLGRLVAHDKLVLAVEWNPNVENMLASGGRDGAIHIWRLDQEEDTGQATTHCTQRNAQGAFVSQCVRAGPSMG